MEEILASIRKIISEDSPEAAPETPSAPALQAAPASTPEPAAQQDDVLELTQDVAIQDAAPAAQEPEHDVVFEPAEPPAVEPADTSDIFSDTTRKAMDDVFAAIPDEDEAPPAAAPAPAPIAPVDAATVETVFERAVRESFEPVLKTYLADNSAAVVERMKPAIREWMDEHFPALLEGAVRAEVERVVRARGARR
jgi:cell pole-organizing protein PopZ